MHMSPALFHFFILVVRFCLSNTDKVRSMTVDILLRLFNPLIRFDIPSLLSFHNTVRSWYLISHFPPGSVLCSQKALTTAFIASILLARILSTMFCPQDSILSFVLNKHILRLFYWIHLRQILIVHLNLTFACPTGFFWIYLVRQVQTAMLHLIMLRPLFLLFALILITDLR